VDSTHDCWNWNIRLRFAKGCHISENAINCDLKLYSYWRTVHIQKDTVNHWCAYEVPGNHPTDSPEIIHPIQQPFSELEKSPVAIACQWAACWIALIGSDCFWPFSNSAFALVFRYLILYQCSLDDTVSEGVLRRQSHRHSGLATLPSVGAIH